MSPTSRLADTRRCLSAIASNLLARFAPALYVRLTRQTGRGAEDVGAENNADYFRRCHAEYCARLGREPADPRALAGLHVLEYGPGDVLGVALMCIAYGAERVVCVDRFPLERLSPANVAIYRALLAGLPEGPRLRAAAAFRVAGDPASGLDPLRIEYRVTHDGTSGAEAAFDLILSRAVLEHVHDLAALFADMRRALRPGGVAVHQVDLKSHGLDRQIPFDFLSWPGWLYALMYSHKGFPNRWRVGLYRRWAEAAGLELKALAPTGMLSASELAAVRPRIRPELATGTADDELGWLGFWMELVPARHTAAGD
ncbi:MAG TPA: methyltransferase type 12 [Gammaproteobacteria bacterium]|nr:methyltransferase type 12 [Gammaproteobacteria bacterium]